MKPSFLWIKPWLRRVRRHKASLKKTATALIMLAILFGIGRALEVPFLAVIGTYLGFAVAKKDATMRHTLNLIVEFAVIPMVMSAAWESVLPAFWPDRPALNFTQVWLMYVSAWGIFGLIGRTFAPRQVF